MSRSQNWARATVIARPWPDSSSPREPKHLRNVMAPQDVSMDDVNNSSPVIHVFEMEAQSALAQLRDLQLELKSQAGALEQKVKRAAMGPFEIVRNFLSLI